MVRMRRAAGSAGAAAAVAAALIGAVLAVGAPGSARAQGAGDHFRGPECVDTGCVNAPPEVYACLSRQFVADPVFHSRVSAGLDALEKRRTPEAAERMLSALKRSTCNAEMYRLSITTFRRLLTETPFVGRRIETVGRLTRDDSGNVRVQPADGAFPWILEPGSFDEALVGKTVRVQGLGAGAGRLRAAAVTVRN